MTSEKLSLDVRTTAKRGEMAGWGLSACHKILLTLLVFVGDNFVAETNLSKGVILPGDVVIGNATI